MGPGSRVPFQRAMSVDSKPFTGARGTGRRSAPSSLIKQESLDSHLGMGEEKYSTLILRVTCLVLRFDIDSILIFNVLLN